MSETPEWLTELIASTIEWAVEAGYAVGRDIAYTRIAAISGADSEIDYLT